MDGTALAVAVSTLGGKDAADAFRISAWHEPADMKHREFTPVIGSAYGRMLLPLVLPGKGVAP